VQEEIVKANRSSDLRVYFVWLPMLPSDTENDAAGMARTLAARRPRHFYDPNRRAGIAFVEDHFHQETREALAALPEGHPFRKRLARWAAAPASLNPLWDAVLFFPAGAEWNEKSPRPQWWTKQIGFSGEGERGKPTGQFLRNRIKDGPVESDWFVEARKGLASVHRGRSH
jgi:hypothetical protein